MIPSPDFASHRARLLEALPDGEAVLVFASPSRVRNGTTDYRYRPNSDLYWLTGWEDPEAVVFIRHGDAPVTMFVQPKNPERETWDGFRHGPDGAERVFGADAAFAIEELASELPRLLKGVHTLHYDIGKSAENDALVHGAIARAARAGRKTGDRVPETFVAPSRLLHELRLIKGEDEIAIMAEAGRLSAEAHCRAMQSAKDGMPEYLVESALMHTFLDGGSTGAGYTPIVASGANATVLHYVTNRDTLAEGELLLIDAGCEVHYYTADITRTFPVSGTFTDAQRQVYEVVLSAQRRAIDMCRPGTPFQAVHDTAVRALTEGMVELGLLEGNIDALIADEAYKRYYMHGTSHWLGLDVHDVGSYGRGTSRALEAGMVLTVEPGLYIRNDDTEAPERFRGIGIRIEDDILVTDAEPVELTAAVPKTIEAVEAMCRGLEA